jgi:raffinose/stachyose/melibiose transport system substrate-binding protein
MTTRRAFVRAALGTVASAPLWSCAKRSDRIPIRVLHIETNRDVLAVWEASAREFEAIHPEARVEFRVLEAAAFKARLPTLLQSDRGPHLFYSWGGALVDVQRSAGLLEDISSHLQPSYVARFMPLALDAYRRDGRYYGLPYLATEIGLLANRDILRDARIDIESLGDWQSFLSAVKRLRARGITPITAGGMDRWPLSLIHSHLALRVGGKDELLRAMENADPGFSSAPYLQATRAYEDLVALRPFQGGVLGSKAQTALAEFAGGRAAFLMHGSWFYRQAAALQSHGDARLFERFAFMGFPRVAGGAGEASETQGQLNGWLVRRGAPPLAIEFLKHWLDTKTQRRLAEGGFIVPANLEAQRHASGPLQTVAERLNALQFLQIEWTTLLGPNGGGAAADAAAGLTGATMSAAEALALIDRGWRIDQNNMSPESARVQAR